MRLLLIIGLQFVALYAKGFDTYESRIIFPDDKKYFQIVENREPQGAIETVTNSADGFAGNFFKVIANKESGNLICSPFSTSMALSWLSYGAAGNTRSQLRTALQFPTDDNVASFGFRKLVETLASYKTVNLKVANGIFLSDDFNVKPNFKDISTKVFNSTAETVDFSDSWTASFSMNRWCSQQTNGLIKEIVSPDDVSSLTKVVLMNAVYFKGQWVTKFPSEKTAERTFYDNNFNEKKITTMFVLGKFRLGSLPAVRSNYIELPYKTENAAHNVSMFVILPWERYGLAKLEECFDKVTMRELLVNREAESKVRVTLPKFRIESTMQLEQPLKTMGMTGLFKRADLSELTDQQVQISTVMQKAVIEIDEQGSRAAAVTVSPVTALMAGDDGINNFFADHPFLIVIGTVSDNPINLFTARFTG